MPFKTVTGAGEVLKNDYGDAPGMIKGPLVYSAFGLACILIALSFLIVILPDQIETLGMVAGVVAVLVVVVLVAILIKTRRGGVERRVLR